MNLSTKKLIRFFEENDDIYKETLNQIYIHKRDGPPQEAFFRFELALKEFKLDEQFDFNDIDLMEVFVELFL